MYAFGGVAGQTGSQQTWAGAATYATGPFSVAAGYIRMNNASSSVVRPNNAFTSSSDGTIDSIVNGAYATAKSIGIASVAVQFVTGPFTAGVRYSNAQYKPDGASTFVSTERYNVAGGYLGYQVTPAALLGLGYTYTHGSGDTSASYNQVSLGADYNLSKRTDLYLVGAWQRASGTQHNPRSSPPQQLQPAVASVADYGFTGDSRTQEIVSLGIRHKF